MSEPEQVEVGASDIESLAGKLETLFESLNEQEQALLSHVLQTAAESASEVSGYAAVGFSPGIALDLAGAAGIRDVSSKVRLHDFSFTKRVDKASPNLFL
jgi:hypothetical protein